VPVLNVQWITPVDGQRNCPKHVEFLTRINLEISASVGFIVKKSNETDSHFLRSHTLKYTTKLQTIQGNTLPTSLRYQNLKDRDSRLL